VFRFAGQGLCSKKLFLKTGVYSCWVNVGVVCLLLRNKAGGQLMILLLIILAYWAYNKGKPLRWYELLALVIGYLLTVYPVNIFINSREELYVLGGVMLALGLIILVVDFWYIVHRR
jgi:hypothetical protein